MRNIFDNPNYDKRVPAVDANAGRVNITFRLDLYQLLEVVCACVRVRAHCTVAQNEPRQSITLNAWVEERWCDDTLYWDPAEFGNQTSISVPHEIVWLPDTLLYNRCVRARAHTHPD